MQSVVDRLQRKVTAVTAAHEQELATSCLWSPTLVLKLPTVLSSGRGLLPKPARARAGGGHGELQGRAVEKDRDGACPIRRTLARDDDEGGFRAVGSRFIEQVVERHGREVRPARHVHAVEE